MEDHAGAGQRVPPGLPGGGQPGEIPLDDGDPRVGGQVRRRRDPVQQSHPGQRAFTVTRHVQGASRQQVPGQAGAQEPGAAGNHHIHHGVSVPGRGGGIQCDLRQW